MGGTHDEQGRAESGGTRVGRGPPPLTAFRRATCSEANTRVLSGFNATPGNSGHKCDSCRGHCCRGRGLCFRRAAGTAGQASARWTGRGSPPDSCCRVRRSRSRPLLPRPTRGPPHPVGCAVPQQVVDDHGARPCPGTNSGLESERKMPSPSRPRTKAHRLVRAESSAHLRKFGGTWLFLALLRTGLRSLGASVRIAEVM
jgi:hypothetical protein